VRQPIVWPRLLQPLQIGDELQRRREAIATILLEAGRDNPASAADPRGGLRELCGSVFKNPCIVAVEDAASMGGTDAIS